MVNALRASDKPVAACAVAPDGRQWLSGSLEGLLSYWDSNTGLQTSSFTPHAKPISAISFSPDGQALATASWDRNLILWDLSRERIGRTLYGHEDIVSGCRFSSTGHSLYSWSYDGTMRHWDVVTAQLKAKFQAHPDRVTCGGLSPDGLWAATGCRDHRFKLWDLQKGKEVKKAELTAEVRACLFLLDSERLITVDAKGKLTLWALPKLDKMEELLTNHGVQCAELSPSGATVVLGGEDGLLRYVNITGITDKPLHVTLFGAAKRTATTMQKFFGQSTLTVVYRGLCPYCRYPLELPERPEEPVPCPGCQHLLRVTGIAPAVQRRPGER